jgi:hypothetical protein
MKIIKWVALRRFNYIDGTGQIIAAIMITQDHPIRAAMVIVVSIIASIIVEGYATSCPKS